MNLSEINEFERVRKLAHDVAESMCQAYLLGLAGQAVEFYPRNEYDRDAWVMGNNARSDNK
jgi:hypothetical protein